MTTTKIHKCHCGKEKPYRRAYDCKQCWDELGKHGAQPVRPTSNNQQTLRLNTSLKTGAKQ